MIHGRSMYALSRLCNFFWIPRATFFIAPTEKKTLRYVSLLPDRVVNEWGINMTWQVLEKALYEQPRNGFRTHNARILYIFLEEEEASS